MTKIFEHDSSSNLFKCNMGPMLKSFNNSCSNWSTISLEPNIFTTLVSESGSSAGHFEEQIFAIFKLVLQNSSNIPEVQLKIFLLMGKLFNRDEMVGLKIQGISSVIIKGKSASLLKSPNQDTTVHHGIFLDLIMPHLKWHSGKKSAAVRIGASSVLWIILDRKLVSGENLLKLQPEMQIQMNVLVEDSERRAREFALKSFISYFKYHDPCKELSAKTGNCKPIF